MTFLVTLKVIILHNSPFVVNPIFDIITKSNQKYHPEVFKMYDFPFHIWGNKFYFIEFAIAEHPNDQQIAGITVKHFIFAMLTPKSLAAFYCSSWLWLLSSYIVVSWKIEVDE